MQVGSSDSDEADVMVDMNTTPLIDVMLVLLIMLIITIPIQTHAVKLDMPVGNPPPPPVPPEVVDIGIDFDGTITWVNASKGVNDVIASDQDFRKHVQAAVNETEPPEIHINPNKLATYKYVTHVLAEVQRGGLKKIGLVGNAPS
jgi:biopolymer transport protein ExbD